MINIRLEKNFLQDIDNLVKTQNYQSRTELIRESLREKIEEKKLIEAVKKLRGSWKTKTSNEDYEKMKERIGKRIIKKFT